MSDMFSISMVAILVSGIIGIVREYGGVEWLVGAISGKIKNRRGAEYGIGLMSGILSAAMVNNTIAIIVTCPIAKKSVKIQDCTKETCQSGRYLCLCIYLIDAT